MSTAYAFALSALACPGTLASPDSPMAAIHGDLCAAWQDGPAAPWRLTRRYEAHLSDPAWADEAAYFLALTLLHTDPPAGLEALDAFLVHHPDSAWGDHLPLLLATRHTDYIVLSADSRCPEGARVLADAPEDLCTLWDDWMALRPPAAARVHAVSAAYTARSQQEGLSPEAAEAAAYYAAVAWVMRPHTGDALRALQAFTRAHPDGAHLAEAYMWTGDIAALGCGGGPAMPLSD